MDSYWRDREEQAQAEYALTDEQYVEQLNDIYDYMLDQVKKEVNGFYSKYATTEGITMAEAQKRVAQVDIDEYERKAKKYVAEKDFSDQANREMRLYNLTMKVNRLQMLEANIGLETVSGFDELSEKLGEDLTERALQEMSRQAGILGATVQNNAKTANSIVGASFHNATFSDRIWMYQAQLRDELDGLLRNGLIQGQNPNELARHINNLFDTGKYNCERLLRTELTRVQSDAQLQSFIAAGFDEYQFNALGNACPVCRELDEQHFRIADAQPGENLPPIHPNCRCAVSAYMDDESYNEWLDSYKDHGMSYEDWLENRPTAVDAGKITRDYECDLAQTLGKEAYDKLCDMADACENESLKKLWGDLHNKVVVADSHYHGIAYTTGDKIYFDADEMLTGNGYDAPFQTVFHESCHAIDHIANEFGWYSCDYEDGKFRATIVEEVNKWVNSEASTIKQYWKEHDGDWESLIEKGYMSRGELAFYERQGEWPNNTPPKYSKSLAYEAVQNEILGIDLMARGNVSDIVEGATKCKVMGGIGHGAKYWKTESHLTLEAFAEFCDASFTNPESLAAMKQCLPNSYEVWHNMVESMVK